MEPRFIEVAGLFINQGFVIWKTSIYRICGEMTKMVFCKGRCNKRQRLGLHGRVSFVIAGLDAVIPFVYTAPIKRGAKLGCFENAVKSRAFSK